MTVLVLADHDGSALGDATARAVAAARRMGDAVHVIVAGKGVEAIAAAAARIDGVDRVLLADGDAFDHQLAEPVAALLVEVIAAGGHAGLVAAATSVGKDVLPRVAALLDVMQISEAVAIHDAGGFDRPIYAGNAIETVRSADRIKVVTIRASAFDPAASRDASAPVESIHAAESPPVARFAHEALSRSDRPELTSARIVVSGGRALGSAQAFSDVLGPLATRLHAAIGASRAAVDAGYAANDLQVGQTGKIVAPQLYIALGISGAIQHLAGMKDARIIVAVNKDPDAPIFQVADYGVVADLFTFVPALEQALG